MKPVFFISCLFVLTACNTYGPYPQHGQAPVGSQNQYIPVIISDDNDGISAPAISVCSRQPYRTYSNSPNYCGYAPIMHP